MTSYSSIAAAILFVMSPFFLARANGWSRWLSAIVSAGALVVPLSVAFDALNNPMPAVLAEFILGAASVAAIIVLFALAKAVADKLNAARAEARKVKAAQAKAHR